MQHFKQYFSTQTQVNKSKVFIFNNKHRLLMLCNKDDTWELPGGRKEPGESAEHVAIREVAEETNLTINKLHAIKVMSDGCALFVGEVDSEEVTVSDEHKHFEWIKTRNIYKMNLSKKTVKYMKVLSQVVDLVDQLA